MPDVSGDAIGSGQSCNTRNTRMGCVCIAATPIKYTTDQLQYTRRDTAILLDSGIEDKLITLLIIIEVRS